jgi:hypothetical protein
MQTNDGCCGTLEPADRRVKSAHLEGALKGRPAVVDALRWRVSNLPQEDQMAKYGESASKNVKSTMRRRKKGTLKSGSGRKVKSRKQAIAIGLNEARKKGAKVPRKSSSSRKRTGKKR